MYRQWTSEHPPPREKHTDAFLHTNTHKPPPCQNNLHKHKSLRVCVCVCVRVCLSGRRDIIVCLSPASSKCTFQGAGLGISMATAKRPGALGGRRWWAVGMEAGVTERGDRGGNGDDVDVWRGVLWSQRGMLGTQTWEHCDIFMCRDGAG